MEYKIIKSSSIDVMSHDVNYHIREGWIPLGGISTTVIKSDKSWSSSNEEMFYQSMVKYEKDEMRDIKIDKILN